jgi:hypothetical protein
MGTKTGRPRGRPPGAKNKRTADRERQMAEVAERIGETLEDAFEGDAHALLVAIYKDRKLELGPRLDAAKAAIRYEKPALSSIDSTVEADVRATVSRIELVGVKPSDNRPA